MNTKFIYIFSLIFILLSCTMEKNSYQKANQLFQQGNFSDLKKYAEHIKNQKHPDSILIQKLDSLQDIASRIRLDFSISEQRVDSMLKEQIDTFTAGDKERWEKKGWLEYRLFDGEKRYFNRSVSNLKLRLAQQKDSTQGLQPSVNELSKFRMAHTEKVIAETKKAGQLTEPVHYTITYTLTVKPDVVPAGETLKCWLPYPKENRDRQTDVKLLETSQPDFIISPDTSGHRSLFMEKNAQAGKPTIFQIKYSFTAYAQYFDLSKINILPYNKNSEIYKQYTAEQPPHIAFTPQIKSLADKIVGNETNPVKIVKKLYDWIDNNIIWSGALEYSTMPNIPKYVLNNDKGDCGMQTLLFISMARYKGIPVKWQSGWMLHPDAVNLHDWSEVYYQGIGWVPLDMSFGRQQSSNYALRYFYMSGMDAYRLIVNDKISAEFSPQKTFLRSETVDFQRGEVESETENLYFDKWNYNMEVEYK